MELMSLVPLQPYLNPDLGARLSLLFVSVGGQECQKPAGIPLTIAFPFSRGTDPRGQKDEEEEAALSLASASATSNSSLIVFVA